MVSALLVFMLLPGTAPLATALAAMVAVVAGLVIYAGLGAFDRR